MPAIVDTAVTATTTATKLIEGSPRRRNLTLTNNCSVTVYLGSVDVSTSAFFRPLTAGETVEFTRGPGGDDPLPEAKWYGVTASSTASVAVGEVLA